MSVEIPYLQREQHILQDDFQHILQTSGRTLLGHSHVYTDPSVLKQRWLVTPSGRKYDEKVFYTAFDDVAFRRALRFLVAHPSYTPDQIASLALSPAQFTFLQEQEFLMKLPFWEGEEIDVLLGPPTLSTKNIHWLRGPACQYIPNIGHTLEWYVAEWFRCEYHALARHSVKVKELSVGGDLDVVALKDGMRIAVECKSSSHIQRQKLHLFSQRATDFHADITLLLIDTESADPVEIRTKTLCTILDQPYNPKQKQLHKKTVFRWIPSHNIYITNTGAGIASTLKSILRFHEARIQLSTHK